VNKNKDSNFFLDEVLLSQNQISSNILADISRTISNDKFLWIACQSDRLPSKNDPNLTGKSSFSYFKNLQINIIEN
jgi:hypothetical protein